MKLAIDMLHPEADLGGQVWIDRHQTLLRKGFVQVFANDVRLDHRASVVD